MALVLPGKAVCSLAHSLSASSLCLGNARVQELVSPPSDPWGKCRWPRPVCVAGAVSVAPQLRRVPGPRLARVRSWRLWRADGGAEAGLLFFGGWQGDPSGPTDRSRTPYDSASPCSSLQPPRSPCSPLPKGFPPRNIVKSPCGGCLALAASAAVTAAEGALHDAPGERPRLLSRRGAKAVHSFSLGGGFWH